MRKLKPSRLRKILWRVMKDGKQWWMPRYKFGTGYRILNDSWVLNFRSVFEATQGQAIYVKESALT